MLSRPSIPLVLLRNCKSRVHRQIETYDKSLYQIRTFANFFARGLVLLFIFSQIASVARPCQAAASFSSTLEVSSMLPSVPCLTGHEVYKRGANADEEPSIAVALNNVVRRRPRRVLAWLLKEERLERKVI